ncbi:hypothetical protein [Streptomyces sp. RKAG337]|uniref:hypothetical protein n=1 Tax=Streptomyces sp. RKAG337 TaxID=2893404 RepID=UPI0020336B68|nr:hypothetical protein [Streptomyces sp. RKAG337]MCM2427369.1 hypothetical protein [Streptomyces sp. RKAG337]
MDGQRPVIIHAPSGGARRVTIRGQDFGLATHAGDVIEFLRRAGLEVEDADLADPDVFEWRGGGPDDWPTA